jgi:hypothetical protein
MKSLLLLARKGRLHGLSGRFDYADPVAAIATAEARFPALVGIIWKSA